MTPAYLVAFGLMMLIPLRVAASSAPVTPVATSCELNKFSANRWDYRRERWHPAHRERFEWQLKDLEVNHFRPQTEMLVRPTTGRSIGGDLQYVLRLWPNHHRALATLVRLGEREHTDVPRDAYYTIGCYFERALDYAPDDTVVRGLYADYLARQSQRPQALAQLERLKHYADQSPMAHHNAGLIYFELKEFERALEQAHRAEELGMPAQNMLRRRLEEAGKWKPREAPQAASATAAASAASGAAESPRAQP